MNLPRTPKDVCVPIIAQKTKADFLNNARNLDDLAKLAQEATPQVDVTRSWLNKLNLLSPSQARIRQTTFSVVDQALSVGGIFLITIALARTQTQQIYGIFALTYSVFIFLVGLHNAAILEAYTIYGSGRYHRQFPAYERLLWRTNVLGSLALSVTLVVAWRALAWMAPDKASYTLLGMALSCGIFLMASFIRRTFYMRRRPDLAA